MAQKNPWHCSQRLELVSIALGEINVSATLQWSLGCRLYSCPSQKHFLKTICGPYSSYSSRLIHAQLNVGMLASTAPPLHTEKFLSAGLVTRTLPPVSAESRPLISAWRRSGRPASRVFPPSTKEKTWIVQQGFGAKLKARSSTAGEHMWGVRLPENNCYLTARCFQGSSAAGQCLSWGWTWRCSRASHNGPVQSALV